MSLQIDRFAAAGTELPSKTQAGRLFFLVDLGTPSNSKLYASFAVDTWTEISNDAGSVATVSSVFGRTGAVVGASTDINFDDSGTGITATTVDGALKDLDARVTALENA